MNSRFLAATLAAVVLPYARAQAPEPDLSGSTMEQLTQMEVSINSVSRKDQDLWSTAAAAYVLTREDIEHSAADSIPELLRSVPGLQVAQISASTWAVSARGFNSAFANKLLVLVDGRTVYSEIYSGAHWDEIDLALDDVERIEVIRGPGAVIWGTNAVNGVINIITRPARAVQSPVVSGQISRIDRSSSFIQGSSFLNAAQYLDSLSVVNRNPLENATGSPAFDGELLYRANGRLDLRKGGGTQISLLAGGYGGTLRQEVLPNSSSMTNFTTGQENDFLAGGFALVRVQREMGRHAFEVQSYVSDSTRHELSATDRTITESLEFVDHYAVSPKVDLVSGGELRLTQDAAHAPMPVLLKPTYNNYLLDGFLQADFNLLPHHLTATLGAKVQDGTLAGFQVQPTARLAWTIDPRQFAWVAASRGVVAPSIQDSALSLDILLGTADGLQLQGALTGDPAIKPETVLAYEAGYRQRLTPQLSADIAAFFNDNRRLQSVQTGMPTLMMDPYVHVMVPLTYGNGFAATTQGVEGSLDWKPRPALSLRVNYTWLEAQISQTQPGSLTLIDDFDSPRNSVAGLWSWRFAHEWSFDGQLDRVGTLGANPSTAGVSALSGMGTGGMGAMFSHLHPADDSMDDTVPNRDQSVAGYTRLDFEVDHHVGNHLAFAAGGTNLLSPRHLEFDGSTTFLTALYVPRSLFVRAHWSF